MLGFDSGVAVVEIAAGLQNHDDLFQRTIPGALADPVDGALHLPGAGFDGHNRIGYRQPQVVVTMHADHRGVAQRPGHAADQRAVFVRHRVAHRIRNVDRAGPGLDHGQRDLVQVVGRGARAVFGRELHVVRVLPRQLHGPRGFLQHLLLGLLELVLQVNLAGGDEGVNARLFGVGQRLGGALHVQRAAARQRRHPGLRELAAHGIHRLEIALGSDGKARFQNVDAQVHQFPRHPQLLRNRHATAGRLFPVAQRRVENSYAVAHRHHYAGSCVI